MVMTVRVRPTRHGDRNRLREPHGRLLLFLLCLNILLLAGLKLDTSWVSFPSLPTIRLDKLSPTPAPDWKVDMCADLHLIRRELQDTVGSNDSLFELLDINPDSPPFSEKARDAQEVSDLIEYKQWRFRIGLDGVQRNTMYGIPWFVHAFLVRRASMVLDHPDKLDRYMRWYHEDSNTQDYQSICGRVLPSVL